MYIVGKDQQNQQILQYAICDGSSCSQLLLQSSTCGEDGGNITVTMLSGAVPRPRSKEKAVPMLLEPCIKRNKEKKKCFFLVLGCPTNRIPEYQERQIYICRPNDASISC